MSETLETVRDWGTETFGDDGDLLRYLDRTSEEFDELRDEVVADNADGIAMEAADVIICLSRLTTWAHVERKMEINRARKWRKMGDGTGYHE